MEMVALSKSQQIAMNALPLHYSRWGSSVMGSDFPKGVTMATINRLIKLDLVKIKRDGPFSRIVVKA